MKDILKKLTNVKGLFQRIGNWKSTLLGVLAAVLLSVGSLLEAGEVGQDALLAAAGTAALGALFKDPKKKDEEQEDEDIPKAKVEKTEPIEVKKVEEDK